MFEGLINVLRDVIGTSGAADWGLLVIATITAAVALFQVNEARRLREEQAQPYVVVGMRRVTGHIVEIYVVNLGKTVAYNVHLESRPELVAMDQGFWMFKEIPALVPGQEWSTIWEAYSYKRIQSDLPKRHDVESLFNDYRGKSHRVPSVLDWNSVAGASYIVPKGVDDVAKTLEKIAKSIGHDVAGQRNMLQALHNIAERPEPESVDAGAGESEKYRLLASRLALRFRGWIKTRRTRVATRGKVRPSRCTPAKSGNS